MSEATLSSINIFPVKSLGGISLSQGFVGESGLSFDRRFMLSDPEGQLLSARQIPSLLQFQVLLRDDGIEIIAPDGEHLTVRYPELFQNYRQVTVWGTEINAQHCGAWFDEWLSQKLGRECLLLYFGEQSERFTSRRPDKPVAFADGYPLLVISEASLNDLNSRTSTPITMGHFRTNLIIKDCEAFAEDSWKRIRIGEVEFEVVKPCSRCVMTTYDPATGQKMPNEEPISTLSKYRMDANNEVFFGQNLIPLNEGKISINDTIEVLEHRSADVYPVNAPLINQPEKPLSPTLWPVGQEQLLTCIQRIEETVDVTTFRFSLPQELTTEYIAGQFITLNLMIDDQAISRCYTLSSSPSRPQDLAITVKKITDGKVSNWLHNNLAVGDKIKALPPMGIFNESVTGTGPLLLLSAGSGITPMLSVARQLTDTHSQRDTVFYYQARTEADLICADELIWLARQNPKLRLIFSLSQPSSSWQGVTGRISREQLAEHVPDLTERVAMCCGPEGFMSRAKEDCIALGLNHDHWFDESFDTPPGVDPSADQHNVQITYLGKRFSGDNKHSLLDQLESNGAALPNGCRAGLCGVCKVKLLSGEVHRSSEMPLTDEEKMSGIILACSCTPETNVVIEA